MRPFAIEKIPEFFMKILPHISVTLEYVVLAFLFGLFSGTLVALAKISRNAVLRGIAYGYTTVMRCTPSIVLLFLVYYGLPRLLEAVTGIKLDSTEKVKFIVITLSMFCTASLSEVIRSAYESLDKSQMEAAASVGLTRPQAFFHILLPQMLYSAVPNLCNTLLILLKEGSLAYTIGLFDLLGQANYIIGLNMGAYVIEVYVALILIYWPLAILIGALAKRLEKRLDYNTRQYKPAKRRVAHGN
ncbi:MAG: amino acid ABC transporter permease [Oscillospiraceae bacterium]